MEGRKQICLFTAHSPASGGGGAILRSLVANLPHIAVAWYYTGSEPATGYEAGYLGQGIMGGPFLKDISQSWDMLNNKPVKPISTLVQQLLAITCDEYWIITHNEGLRMAFDLATLQKERPVHVTVHDDWAGALSARSVRYRFMARAALRLTVKTLQAVASFDVISRGMQVYYQQLSGLRGNVCHRYLPAQSIHTTIEVEEQANEVRIGHIGSIYRKEDLLAFIHLAKHFFEAAGKKPVLQMWGCHLTINDIPAALKSYVVFYPTLAEEEVIPQLAKCSFVYAMYPMQKSLRVFAKTSLPTKLTSYLQSGRPVFGHCPADSSLSEYLHTTGLGAQWNTRNTEAGYIALRQVTTLAVKPGQLMAARENYFGENNLAVIDRAFGVIKS